MQAFSCCLPTILQKQGKNVFIFMNIFTVCHNVSKCFQKICFFSTVFSSCSWIIYMIDIEGWSFNYCVMLHGYLEYCIFVTYKSNLQLCYSSVNCWQSVLQYMYF